MQIVVDPVRGVPVYRQIMDQIKLQIAGGLLEPGQELPSTRSLAADLGVNPMTVSKAYGRLESDGVLERRPGLPLVVAEVSDTTLRTRRLEQLRKALSPAATAARQLGVDPAEAVDAFRKLLEEPNDERD